MNRLFDGAGRGEKRKRRLAVGKIEKSGREMKKGGKKKRSCRICGRCGV